MSSFGFFHHMSVVLSPVWAPITPCHVCVFFILREYFLQSAQLQVIIPQVQENIKGYSRCLQKINNFVCRMMNLEGGNHLKRRSFPPSKPPTFLGYRASCVRRKSFPNAEVFRPPSLPPSLAGGALYDAKKGRKHRKCGSSDLLKIAVISIQRQQRKISSADIVFLSDALDGMEGLCIGRDLLLAHAHEHGILSDALDAPPRDSQIVHFSKRK